MTRNLLSNSGLCDATTQKYCLWGRNSEFCAHFYIKLSRWPWHRGIPISEGNRGMGQSSSKFQGVIGTYATSRQSAWLVNLLWFRIFNKACSHGSLAMAAVPNKPRQETSRVGCFGTLTRIFFNANHQEVTSHPRLRCRHGSPRRLLNFLVFFPVFSLSSGNLQNYVEVARIQKLY